MATEQEQMRQRSRIRQVAEERESGFSTTTLKLPEGLKFFKPELGLNTVDIIGYKTGSGNPKCPDVGVLWYERTYWRYGEIGPEKKSYVAAGKTFGKKDPIQDWLKRAALDGSQDKKYLDSLKPKERQLFLVFDHKHPELGIQLWDVSYHNFGKTLLDVIQASPEERGWDFFYFPDTRGFTLDLTVINETMGKGNPFKVVGNISFIPRRAPLDDKLANHGYCLDTFPIETPYDVLWRAFHGLPADGSQDASVAGGLSGTASESSVGGTMQPAQHTATTAVGLTTGSTSSATDPPRHTEAQRQQVAQESVEDQRKRIVEMAGAAYHNGQKRDGNPFDKGTDRYTWWLEGYMDAMSAGPPASVARTEPAKPALTAADKGIGKMAEVLYNGVKHTVFRIAPDGTTLTLVTEADDMVPNVPVGAVELVKTTTMPTTTAQPTTNGAAKQQTQQPQPTTAPAAEEDEWGKDWTNN